MKVSITKKEFLQRYDGTTTENVFNALEMLSKEKIEFDEEKQYILTKTIAINGEVKNYYFMSGDNLTSDIGKAETFNEEDKNDPYWNEYTTHNRFNFHWKEV